RALLLALLVAALLLVPPGVVKHASGLLFETESPYQYVSVVRESDGSRVLELNEGLVAHSVWQRNTVLTGGYWDLFLLLPPLLEHLRPGGMVALNVAATPEDRRLSRAIGTTLLSVFPQAWRWRALRFNDLLLGLDRPASRGELLRRVAHVRGRLASLVPLFRRELAPVRASGAPLTDDRAPVEWITDRMLVD